MALTWLASRPAVAQVTIEGGQDLQSAPNHYEWTVTNKSGKSISSLQIPHYRGNIFTAPDGWEFTMTNKVEFRMEDETGLISATAQNPRSAIRPGQSAAFGLRAFHRGTAPASANVTVGFADGTTEIIPNVEVPWRIPWFRKYTLLVGFGAMFAVFLLVQAVRGRKHKQPKSDPSPFSSS